jgi:hypothetical protein
MEQEIGKIEITSDRILVTDPAHVGPGLPVSGAALQLGAGPIYFPGGDPTAGQIISSTEGNGVFPIFAVFDQNNLLVRFEIRMR